MAADARSELIEYLGGMYAPSYPGYFRDGWGEGDDVIDHLLKRPDLLCKAMGMEFWGEVAPNRPAWAFTVEEA